MGKSGNRPAGRETCAAVFFDIDGTLLVPGRDFNKEQREREAAGGALPKPPEPLRRPEPTPAVRNAFDEMHRRRHLALICTGRPKGFCSRLFSTFARTVSSA